MSQLNNCSAYAFCTDLEDGYNCTCKDGYKDKSERGLSGRICVFSEFLILHTHTGVLQLKPIALFLQHQTHVRARVLMNVMFMLSASELKRISTSANVCHHIRKIPLILLLRDDVASVSLLACSQIYKTFNKF